MTITKQQLIESINKISTQIDILTDKIANQEKEINILRTQNIELKNASKNTINKISDYIKELEEIKEYYVNSNNNTGE